SQLHVDLAVDETDVVRIAPGQPVTLRLDALPDAAIRGTVTRIAAVPTVAGQLVTYPVEVTIDPGDQPVRIGMSATATITVRELSDIIVLPNRFIRIDRDTGQAFVVVESAPGDFREVQVALGERGEIESEIVSGLNDGDVVVLLPRETFDPFTGPPGG
ncbi:MAG: HlyD family efflux transporter periplasmic adaptor subunit, partial [Anaerolinea sp.]|nr:HlyD family efflux transporter periplasmic adaptor subunit [Anaerolinea sp.]